MERISEESPLYLKERERKGKPRMEAWGSNAVAVTESELLALQWEEENSKPSTTSRSEILDDDFGMGDRSYVRSVLSRGLLTEPDGDDEWPVRREAMLDFFRDACRDEKIGPSLAALGVTEKVLSYKSAAQALKEGAVDAELLWEMTRLHVSEFQRKAELLAKKIERYQEEFTNRVLSAIDEGWLPLTKEAVQKRLRVWPKDFLDPISVGYLAKEGHGTIRVNIKLLEMGNEALRHTVFHEGVHALEGKSIITYEDEDGDSVVKEQKRGLGMLAAGPNTAEKKVKTYFEWLNEAVTEEVALRLLGGPQEKEGYQMERIALDDLIKRGVQEELFFKAYFENYTIGETNSSEEIGLPAWRALAARMNEVGAELTEKGMKMRDFARLFK